MATQYSSGFSVTSGASVLTLVQQAINDCILQMQDAEESPDWPTLEIQTESLPTSLPQMPTILAYSVSMSSV